MFLQVNLFLVTVKQKFMCQVPLAKSFFYFSQTLQLGLESGILRWEIYEVCKLLATDVRLYSLGGLLKFEKEKVDFLREQVTEL